MVSVGPGSGMGGKKEGKVSTEVSIVAQQVRNLTGIHEDTSSIPGLTQWVKDLALLQAETYVTDAAPTPCCCGCGIGWQLQL